MQMPGGRHDTSLDSHRAFRDHYRHRPGGPESRGAHRRTAAAADTAVAACSDVEWRQNNYSSEDNLDTVDVNRRPSSDDTENVIPYTTLDHSRSPFNKFIDVFGKPFVQKRSKSVDALLRRRQAPGESSPAGVQHASSTDDQLSPSPQTSGSTSVVTLAQFANGQIPGTVGIRNHGNTCFMNAVIHCLSNTEFFVEYFVTNEFQAAFLAAQKAGRSCAVTKRLNRLLTSLWTCDYRYNISAAFRNVVGQNAVQYQGTEQNDAQEFLQWLLDRVNEELYGTGISNNQSLYSVKCKQKTESSNEEVSDQVNGSEVAKSSELGIVYDLFLAQFRSTLTCPVCRKQSCKVDPLLLVPLPISEKYKMPVFATVVRRHTVPQLLQVAALLSTCDMVSDLRLRIASQSHSAAEQLVLVQLSDFSFTQTYNDSELMSELDSQMSDLYAIEVRQTDGEADIALIAVNVSFNDTRVKRFGSPFAVNVSRDVSNTELRATLIDCMQDMFKDSAFSQFEQICQMFHIRVVVPYHEDLYLPTDVDLPLYITAIDEVLFYCRDGDGPRHIKVVLEWEYALYKRWMSRSRVNVTPVDDASVKLVKSESQHLSAETLDECFDVFTQQERLGASDRWFCPTCRRYQTGTIKSLSLSSVPDIMVVQLKRFKQDTENRAKLNALIQFPLYGLDMSHRMETSVGINNNTATDEFIYDLYAVCNHSGNLQGGHYTAYCKNPLNDQWYNFDDHHVYKLRQDAVVTKSAYLLFYRRRLAQTRCAVSLQQWVSSVCTASYSNKVPDSVTQTTDVILHNQSDDDGLAVAKTGRQSRTDTKTTEHQRFIRQTHDTRSGRLSRSIYPRTSSTVLMQATLRMHRNPLPLMNMSSAVRQSTPALPVPSDWTTVSSLRTRRRHTAPRYSEDSYIIASTEKQHDTSVDGKLQKALPEPANNVQEPLPTASVDLPSSPPVPPRQPRKPRRRTPADVDNNNSLVDDAASRPLASEDQESLAVNLSTTLTTNVDQRETDVDSIVIETSVQRHNPPAAAARRSLVFEKVPMDMGKTNVRTRRRATERHLPLQESSV